MTQVETKIPPSACCECGCVRDGATGSRKPSPGDLTLCIRCGSLNVFDDALLMRKPTDDEYYAAGNFTLQQLRHFINSMPRLLSS